MRSLTIARVLNLCADEGEIFPLFIRLRHETSVAYQTAYGHAIFSAEGEGYASGDGHIRGKLL